ncbi:hypothetical protein SLNHY_0681 [Streptomyces albus]|nr:hypothetical protein SLNHY_0681 [Streptomyces albus]
MPAGGRRARPRASTDRLRQFIALSPESERVVADRFRQILLWVWSPLWSAQSFSRN